MSPLHSRGSPIKGIKIRSDYITPTFLGARNWAEWLCHPCVLGGSHKRGQNQKWLHHPCLLGDPEKAGVRQPLFLFFN